MSINEDFGRYRQRVVARREWWILVALVFALSSCGGSSKVESTGSATSTTTSVRPCGPSEDGCTSAQVIASVANLYEKAGAKSTEASCLAVISGTGKTAVNQAFEAAKPGETAAAIDCVGSEARFNAIMTSLAEYFTAHPSG